MRGVVENSLGQQPFCIVQLKYFSILEIGPLLLDSQKRQDAKIKDITLESIVLLKF